MKEVLFILIKRFWLYLIIFFNLIEIKKNFYFKNFKNALNDLSEQSFLNSLLISFSNEDITTITKNLFRRRVFKCFTCSCFLWKILRKESKVVLNIGVMKDKNNLESHAWITSSSKIIFGDIKDLEKYKVIYSL